MDLQSLLVDNERFRRSSLISSNNNTILVDKSDNGSSSLLEGRKDLELLLKKLVSKLLEYQVQGLTCYNYQKQNPGDRL